MCGVRWHSTGDRWRPSGQREYERDHRGISIGLRLARATE